MENRKLPFYSNLTRHFHRKSQNTETPSPFSEEQVKYALLAADEVGPHVYDITNHDQEKLRVLVFGCQGDEGKTQIDTAALMQTIQHDYKIGCGDNFYPDGIKTPIDDRFQSQFHGLYGKSPTFLILGNHCGNFSYNEKYQSALLFFVRTPGKTGREVEINQVAHTYLHKTREFYEAKTLDYTALPDWIMPCDYYSTINGKVQTFFLNTNRIAKDYLEYVKLSLRREEIDPAKNQIAWLVQEYKKAREAGRSVTFVQHHPFFCYGKRAYPSGWDASIYLSSDEMTKLDLILNQEPDSMLIDAILNADEKGLSPPSSCKHSDHYAVNPFTGIVNMDYAWALRKMLFSHLGCCPDMTFTAHEHALHVSHHLVNVNNNGIIETHSLCQVVSGGGGGELQDHLYFGGSGEKREENKNEVISSDTTLSTENNENTYEMDALSPSSYFKESELSVTDPEDDSQERHLYGEKEKLALFAEVNGFAVIECDKYHPDIAYIHVHTLDGLHLKFSNLDNTPIRTPSGDEKVELLRECVLEAIRQYHAFLHKQQTDKNGSFYSFINNVTHKKEDARLADNAKNYLNQFEALDYKDTVRYLHNHFFHDLVNKGSNNSLFGMVDRELKMGFDQSLDELYHEIERSPALN
jgi:hypothetical protein